MSAQEAVLDRNAEPPGSDSDTASGGARPPRQKRSAASRIVGWLPWWLRTLAAVSGGVAIALSFPPNESLGPLAVAGPALLALSVRGQRVRRSLWLGFAFSMAFFVPHVAWAGEFLGWLPWTALSIYQSCFLMLLGPAVAAVQRLRWWPMWAACLWVADEALRSREFFGGFPWGRIGFSQDNDAFTSYVAFGGVPLLSFVVALCGFLLAATVFAALRPSTEATEGTVGPNARALRSIALPLAGAVALPIIGAALWLAVPDGSGAPTATVAVIQGDVPEAGMEFNAKRRAVLDNHVSRTLELAQRIEDGKAEQPILVVWPENSSDIDPYVNRDAAERIQFAADEVNAPILVGAVRADPKTEGGLLNTGILWWPKTGPGEVYDKRHPVPFAEYMPARAFFRSITSMVDNIRADFQPGNRPGVFTVDRPGATPLVFGDVICFEVAYDDLVADVIDGGAQILVVQTNNATFGYTGESYQQLAMGRIRAVEHGRTVLSASTSGVSGVIMPDGTVVDRSGLYEPAIFVREVPLLTGTTIADRVDEIPEWTLTLLGLGALVAAVVLRRRSRVKQEEETPEGAE